MKLSRMICLFLFFPVFLFGQEPPLKVRAEVDKAKISISDELTFTITVDSQQGLPYAFPEMGGEILGMRIESFGQKGPTTEDKRDITKKWYKLRPDIAGSYVLPAVEVTYTDPATQARKAVKTSEIFVEVESGPPSTGTAPVGKDGKPADIRDIKALVSIPSPFLPRWAVITLAILFLISLSLILWWRWKRRKPLPPPRVLSPLERAQRDLALLKTSDYLAKGQSKEFHFTLSEIMRSFVENQFSFAATDMTFEEIKVKIPLLKEVTGELKEEFLHVLQETDRVKYTDFDGGKEWGEDLFFRTKKFVEKSAPPPPPEKGPEKGGKEEEEESVV